MSEHTCSVPGCARSASARGWCVPHYSRWHKCGDVKADLPIRARRKPEPDATCEIDGCPKPRYARGLCGMHDSRLRRHGDVGAASLQRIRRVPQGAECSVPGCAHPVLAKGFCRPHYWRQHRHGDVAADVPIHKAIAPIGSTCMESGCDGPVAATGLCRRHYGRRKTANVKADPVLLEALRAYNRHYKVAEYARDPERVRARSRAWKSANPVRVKLHDAKKRRRRRRAPKIHFTVDQLAARIRYWGERCWICYGPWDSVDHVKPLNKGGWHALANLRPICTPCNSRKSDRWPYAAPVAA